MSGHLNTISEIAENTKQLLDTARLTVNAQAALLTTTLPRGGLQIAQPADAPESLVKAYSNGFEADDKLSWRTIAARTPMRMNEAWADQKLGNSAYAREFLGPRELEYGFAVPLKDPVIGGYPGSLHLLRSKQYGDFSDEDIDSVVKFVEEFTSAQRARRKGENPGPHPRPEVYVSAMDQNFQDQLGNNGPLSVDSRLSDQMRSAADRHMQSLNGDPTVKDRLQIPDSSGQHWNFRQITYRRYPALGEGPFTFFCLQPQCGEWSMLQDADFVADQEFSRMIPAVHFMEKEFPRMPTLASISASVHLSPFHFHRRFTELFGITPKQFLLDCQIEHAKSELTAGRKPLATIAKDAGFAHQSHFTSRFKQSTGLTPTRWRRLITQREALNN